ncbi:uncharacterized protein SCHCODRAFT_02176379 [Schizophyllum commune H4-8]|uniref:uncharacterized protein n=1 Tax=Schizophyllum commune (strain H4-8 / FGSC 9210) TaxID=578458 RepID=UPI00215E5344|nr:uncharacterized protein SCHCODRAFT_02176379 [Schizophyllum commune H4-8]KAI5898879.1 hypothetical protein SCHCODRAFT_02176379 [Schizophyllum commune H4-8]
MRLEVRASRLMHEMSLPGLHGVSFIPRPRVRAKVLCSLTRAYSVYYEYLLVPRASKTTPKTSKIAPNTLKTSPKASRTAPQTPGTVPPRRRHGRDPPTKRSPRALTPTWDDVRVAQHLG